MMTEHAHRLIKSLRSDPLVRDHFSIAAWVCQGTCGCVGFIAGTVIAQAYNFEPDRDWNEQKYFDVAGSIINVASKLLGIESRVGEQLFVPWENWFGPLILDRLFNKYSHNERPADGYIAELKAWANGLSNDGIYGPRPKEYTPDICANAVEQVAINHLPYVDWKRAFEEA
jgi:hypothetical protein